MSLPLIGNKVNRAGEFFVEAYPKKQFAEEINEVYRRLNAGGSIYVDPRNFDEATLDLQLDAAIAWVVDQGGGYTIFVPPGSYNTSHSINGVDEIGFIGAAGAFLPELEIVNAYRVTVRHLNVQLLTIDSCSEAVVQDCDVSYSPTSYEWAVGNSNNVTILNNSFFGGSTPRYNISLGIYLSSDVQIAGNKNLDKIDVVSGTRTYVQSNFIQGDLDIGASSVNCVTKDNVLLGGALNDSGTGTYSMGDMEIP